VNRDQFAARRTARLEDLEFMAGTGETVPGAAARLHINPNTLREFLRTQDRIDLLARLLSNQDDRPFAGPHAAVPRSTRRAA
jgi:hypothetical protein